VAPVKKEGASAQPAGGNVTSQLPKATVKLEQAPPPGSSPSAKPASVKIQSAPAPSGGSDANSGMMLGLSVVVLLISAGSFAIQLMVFLSNQ